jgi:flagellar basal-body rod protein FlgC
VALLTSIPASICLSAAPGGHLERCWRAFQANRQPTIAKQLLPKQSGDQGLRPNAYDERQRIEHAGPSCCRNQGRRRRARSSVRETARRCGKQANANANGPSPGSDPYARKTITFESELDEAAGANLVRVASIGTDKQPFRVEYDPGNPAADASGFVKLPNVNIITEMADFREATNSYEANLQIIKQSNNLNSMTLELLRNAS